MTELKFGTFLSRPRQTDNCRAEIIALPLTQKPFRVRLFKGWVVQLYVSDKVSSVTTYEKVLRGFERVHIEPGKTKTVTFKLVPKDHFWLIDQDRKRVVEPGDFRDYDRSFFPGYQASPHNYHHRWKNSGR